MIQSNTSEQVFESVCNFILVNYSDFGKDKRVKVEVEIYKAIATIVSYII